MAITNVHYADFSDTDVIPVAGTVDIELPTACDSLSIYVVGNGANVEIMLNPDAVQGGAAYTKGYFTIPTGVMYNISDYYITEFRLRTTAGTQYSYLAYCSPDNIDTNYSY